RPLQSVTPPTSARLLSSAISLNPLSASCRQKPAL
ncbi:hypothetical protein ID866_1324, partial [Astraeus odoratus]